MAPRPRISVVVYVLNAASSIDRALDSVTSDDQPNVELLVMDGGSTDGTVDIIRKYENKISFWRSYRDGDAAVGLNEGVGRATGDIISLLPADDWIEPGGLKKVQDAFFADPNLDVLSCGTRIVHFEGGDRLVVDAEFLEPKDLEFTIHNIIRSPLACGRFIRRRVYQEVGEYNTGNANDLDFLIRVVLRRPKAKVLPQLVYTYRRHPLSRTFGGQPEKVMEMLRGNICVCVHHMKHSRLLPDERTELRGVHGRCSARLAWMLIVWGRVFESMATLGGAVTHNWLWPVQVVYWFGKYLLKSKPDT